MLTGLIKRAVRPFLRATAPLHRPISRKFDSKLNHMIAAAVRAQILPPIQASLDASARTLDRLEASLAGANRSADAMASDIDLMLGSVVREVARLQAQVGAIEALLSTPSRPGLSLVEPGDDGEPGGWAVEPGRAKVG